MIVFLKRLFKMERYFFISYAHEKGFGRSFLIVKNGKYINFNDFEKKSILKKPDLGKIVIINVIEVFKNDLFS